MRLIYLIHNKNSTRWFPHTFNPLITESMAPVITEFHVTTVYEGYVAPLVPNAKAHVVAEIRDVAGISKVRIRSLCPDVIYILMIWTQEFQFSGEETTVCIDTVIDVTEYSAVLTYNISVNATDTLGNSAKWYKEVDGPFGAFIKTVANMLRAFWDFLCEIGAKIAEAVNVIVEWIMNIINEAVSKIFAPLWESINKWIKEITQYVGDIQNYYNEYLSTGDADALYKMFDSMGKLLSITIVPIFLVVSTIMFALNIVMFTITVLTAGVTTLLSSVISLLIPLILSAFGGTGNEYTGMLPENYIGISLLKYVLDSLLSSQKSQHSRDNSADDLGIAIAFLSLLASIIGWADAEATLAYYANMHYKEIYKHFKYWKTGINKGKVITSCKSDIRNAKTSIVLSAIGFFLSIIQASIQGTAKKLISLGSIIVVVCGLKGILEGLRSITSNKLLVTISLLLGFASIFLSLRSLNISPI